jgi:hypothetical protein
MPCELARGPTLCPLNTVHEYTRLSQDVIAVILPRNHSVLSKEMKFRDGDGNRSVAGDKEFPLPAGQEEGKEFHCLICEKRNLISRSWLTLFGLH